MKRQMCNIGFLSIAMGVGASCIAAAAEQEIELVREGSPHATILVGKQPTRSAWWAARELQYHIGKITGVEIPVVTEAADVKGARILVGESDATIKLGLKNQDFKSQEYIIKFLPDTLVLMGRDQAEAATPAITPTISVHGTPKWTDGKIGKALEFDGKKDVISVENFPFSDSQGTLEAWVWMPPAPSPNAGTILRIDGQGPWSYHLVQRQPHSRNIEYVTYLPGPGCKSVASGELAEGWHHVMATHSAKDKKMELFIDGVSHGVADYNPTTCGTYPLNIGGLVKKGEASRENALNAFVGKIGGVRVSSVVRSATPNGNNKPSAPDAETSLLLNFDEGAGTPKSHVIRPVSSAGATGLFDDQATCYAVYDFLERFCGVRWYGPTELELVCRESPTLKVRGDEIRRSPAFKFRWSQFYWTPSYQCPPFQVFGSVMMINKLWNEPASEDVVVHQHRMRMGGMHYGCGHSFGGYYDRFWEKNPKCPEVFVEKRPEYFAKGYEEQSLPPQMCYTNPAFIKQVIQDANDYFDGKKVYGAYNTTYGIGNFFALCPADNANYCQCPACQAEMNKEFSDSQQFSTGLTSDYFFNFANKVARGIRKTHPDKFISTLAYWTYAYHPKKIALEPNISVQMCLHGRNWWAPSMKDTDMKVYRSWIDNEKGRRPLYVWLYYEFPEWNGIQGKFNCFPGFSAHMIGKQIKMFHQDGIIGAYPETITEQVDAYVMYKLFDDPSLSVDTLLDEFFARYYGNASEPMKQIYLKIEKTFMDSDNYPRDVREQDKCFHQTEEIAWKYLGTAERMAELGALMREAKARARTEIEQKRVGLFEQGVWNHMVEGRDKWMKKTLYDEPMLRRLKSQNPPSAKIPMTVATEADGSLAKVDWTKAARLTGWRTITGYPTKRKVETRLLHDRKYLYIRLMDDIGVGTQLVNSPDIWSGDDWEIFIAPARNLPYRQIIVGPSGKYNVLRHGEVNEGKWENGCKVVSDTSDPMRWIVLIRIPLEKLLPGGLPADKKFYINVYRATPWDANLAWSANFGSSFHELSRLGEVTLE